MIREYICENKKCGETVERIEKFEDVPQTKCPKCQKDTLKLVEFPQTTFILKGKWFKNGGY